MGVNIDKKVDILFLCFCFLFFVSFFNSLWYISLAKIIELTQLEDIYFYASWLVGLKEFQPLYSYIMPNSVFFYKQLYDFKLIIIIRKLFLSFNTY